jgi:hypothetical protein
METPLLDEPKRENCSILGYSAASSDFWSIKMGPIDCPETSVINSPSLAALKLRRIKMA